jgi:hypothetical protein
MRRQRVLRYTIPADLLDNWTYRAGVLDMLRYDDARIRDWNHETITLESSVFTEARWQSFGISPKLIGDDYRVVS